MILKVLNIPASEIRVAIESGLLASDCDVADDVMDAIAELDLDELECEMAWAVRDSETGTNTHFDYPLDLVAHAAH